MTCVNKLYLILTVKSIWLACVLSRFQPDISPSSSIYHTELDRLASSEYVDALGELQYKRFRQRYKILFIGGNYTDDIELVTVLSVLRTAGLRTKLAGIYEHRRKTFKTSFNLTIKPNVRRNHIWLETPYEMIIIPGGKGYYECLDRDDMEKLLYDQDKAFRYIAALSTGGLVLFQQEIGYGKEVTFPPSMPALMGKNYRVNNIHVVHDGHILTCQGPMAAFEFALYIVEIFLGRKHANSVAKEMNYKRKLVNIKIVKPFKN